MLTGAAAHACPPTIARGAATSLADPLVLARPRLAGAPLDDAPESYVEQR